MKTTGRLSQILFASFLLLSSCTKDNDIAISKVVLDQTSVDMFVGECKMLTATIYPESATSKELFWSTSDSNVVVVNGTGMLEALNQGHAIITASTIDGNKKASCVVNVELATGIITGSVEDIAPISVKVSGKAVIPTAIKNDLKIGVLYSTSPGVLPVSSTEVEATTFSNDFGFSVVLKGLQPSTVYYYRCFLFDGDRIIMGEIKSFKTVPFDIRMRSEVRDYSAFDATLNAVVVDPHPSYYDSLECGFLVWREGGIEKKYYTEKYGAARVSEISQNLTSLFSDMKYYYSVYVKFDTYEVKSEVYSFKTLPYEIDMGLSVNWAYCNLGAIKPEESGDFYAWGETEPKSYFAEYNYKWKSNGGAILKYNSDPSYGIVDNIGVLELVDDAVYQKKGGNWRIPTQEEFQELIDKCDVTHEIVNDTHGYRFTSRVKGYTDKSIFFTTDYDGYPGLSGMSPGNYWSSNGTGLGAGVFGFGTSGPIITDMLRDYGRQIRPVCSKY